MAIATTAMKNFLSDEYKLRATHAALHTGDPGTSGSATNECTATGSPAYARKVITWGASAAGVVSNSASPCVFDVYSGATITFASVCSSITQGAATVLDKTSVTSQNFASQGTYTLTLTYTQT